MFCTSCGAKLSDDALFCTYCGQKMSPDDSKASDQTQPVIAQADPISEASAPTLKAPHKKFGVFILITCLLSLVLIAGSAYMPFKKDVADYPFVKVIENVSVVDNLKDELEDTIDSFEELLEDDELPVEERKALKSIISEQKKVLKLPSLPEIRESIEDMSDDFDKLEKSETINADFDMQNELISTIDILMIVLVLIYILPLIFSLLGGILKNKALTITALVFMVLFQLVLCGIVWVALSLIVYITQAVLCGKYQKLKSQPNN